MKAPTSWKDRCERVRGRLVTIVRFIRCHPELRNMLDTLVVVLIAMFATGGF